MEAARKTIDKETRQRYAADPMAFLRELRIPGGDESVPFVEKWAEFQEAAFEVMVPALIAISEGGMPAYRGMWLERTKGTSKDSDVGCCLLWLLLFSKRQLLIELGADKQEQATETLKAMQSVALLNPWMVYRNRIEFLRKAILCKSTNVVCDFLTTTDMAAHGSRPHVSVINELSHISRKQFAETMADNAEKIGNSLMLIATNAGELQTWQYEWREGYRNDPDWWFQKVDCTAPWIPERNINSARKRNSTMRFNRLWRGIWSPREGDAIDPEDIDASVRLDGPMTAEEINGGEWLCILGADAGVKHDHAALDTLAVRYGEPVIRLARVESWAPGPNKKIDLTQMSAAIERAHKTLPVLGMCYDVTQMEHIAQQAAQKGLQVDPINFSGKEADEMVRILLHCFRNRLIAIYPDELLIRDLHRLVIKETRYGHYKLDAVRDDYGHADRAIALAMALPAAALVSMQEPPSEDEGAEMLISV